MVSMLDVTVAEKPVDEDVVLSVEGVSKKFCRSLKRSLLYGVQDIGCELLGLQRHSTQLRKNEFWALQDVNLQLRRAEAVGLVGANGSGKTTLLRIISGLICPDAGRIRVRGRVAPLIALGAGFNPVLTGRENIYANMSILGLSEREIDRQFDTVVDFAEIGEAIDAPVYSYSSGMAARLGFSCAVHTQPDILLIDEVLAVGDARFRLRCASKLNDLQKQGTSFILVSHNSYNILTMCTSAVYLQHGHMILSSDSYSVIERYEKDLFITGIERSPNSLFLPARDAIDSNGLDIRYLVFRNKEGEIVDSLTCGTAVDFCIGCHVWKPMDTVSFRVAIRGLDQEEVPLIFLNSFDEGQCFDLPPGDHELRVGFPYLGLGLGEYTMRVYIGQGNPPGYNLDFVDLFKFTVNKEKDRGISRFYQPCSWMLHPTDLTLKK